MDHFDVLIMTNYAGRDMLTSDKLIEEVMATGKKVIVLSNCPIKKYTPDSWPTVVGMYGVMPPLLRAAAELICGKR
jgi:hypothetical protein